MTLYFESQVTRVCNKAIYDLWLTGEMVEEIRALFHGAMGKPRADYHSDYVDSYLFWRMVLEDWKLVFGPTHIKPISEPRNGSRIQAKMC